MYHCDIDKKNHNKLDTVSFTTNI